MRDEPVRELAERESVPHRQRTGADEALPPGSQAQTFDRPAGRIRPIEHPHGLAVRRSGFEHIAQRGDEGVDAAAEVLQIDQQHVEGVHHRARRAAHFAIETEDGHAVHRVVEGRRLDHVVLLVAAQAVLRAERGRELELAERGQRIERMREIRRHGCGMREHRDAFSAQRTAQLRF